MKHFKEIANIQKNYHDAIYQSFTDEIVRIIGNTFEKIPFFISNFGRNISWGNEFINKVQALSREVIARRP